MAERKGSPGKLIRLTYYIGNICYNIYRPKSDGRPHFEMSQLVQGRAGCLNCRVCIRAINMLCRCSAGFRGTNTRLALIRRFVKTTVAWLRMGGSQHPKHGPPFVNAHDTGLNSPSSSSAGVLQGDGFRLHSELAGFAHGRCL